jgi:hypothetical protein
MFDIDTLRSLGIDNTATQQDLCEFFSGCSLLAGDDRRRQLEVFTCCIKRKILGLEAFGSLNTNRETDHTEQLHKIKADLEAVISEKARLASCLDEEIKKREALESSLTSKKVQTDSTQTPWNCYVEIQISENVESDTHQIITYPSQRQGGGTEDNCSHVKCQMNAETSQEGQPNHQADRKVQIPLANENDQPVRTPTRNFQKIKYAEPSRLRLALTARTVAVALNLNSQ